MASAACYNASDSNHGHRWSHRDLAEVRFRPLNGAGKAFTAGRGEPATRLGDPTGVPTALTMGLRTPSGRVGQIHIDRWADCRGASGLGDDALEVVRPVREPRWARR